MEQKNKHEKSSEYQGWVRARPMRLKPLARLENFQNEPPALVRLALLHPSFGNVVLVNLFLVNLSATRHARVEFDFAEGGFVAADVLLQQSE